MQSYQRRIIWWLGLLILAILHSSSIIASADTLSSPNEHSYIKDELNIINDKTKQNILQTNQNFKTTKQHPVIFVLTVKNTNNQNVQSYAQQVFKHHQWNQYDKQGNSNAVLFVFSKNEPDDDTQVAIIVGNAIQRVIPEEMVRAIIQRNQTWLLARNKYHQLIQHTNSKGIDYTVFQIQQVLNAHYANTSDGEVKPVGNEFMNNLILVVVLICIAIIGTILITMQTKLNQKQKS